LLKTLNLFRGSIPSPIPRGSMVWVRESRASLALLPQLPRQNKSSTGAHVHREPAQASPVLSPGFDSSIGHPLQLVESFSKIRRLQCLDILREALVRKIIELAKTGERDPERLCEGAYSLSL
jgi:hypothetical protein